VPTSTQKGEEDEKNIGTIMAVGLAAMLMSPLPLAAQQAAGQAASAGQAVELSGFRLTTKPGRMAAEASPAPDIVARLQSGFE
jgi:hypothetical protein